MEQREVLGFESFQGVEHKVVRGKPGSNDPEKLVVRKNLRGRGSILLDHQGAKIFKTETSRGYPLPGGLEEKAEETFYHEPGSVPYRDQPKQTRMERVRDFLDRASKVFNRRRRRNRG